MRHGALWMGDPLYRCAWLLGPQFLALPLLVWLFAAPRPPQAPPPPSDPGHWMHPIHTSEESASLKALRDQAMSDPGALAQLDHQAVTGNSLAQFFMGTLHDPYLHLHGMTQAEPMKAVRYYRLAAEQGVDVAATNLGILLLGEQIVGLSKDFAEARRLFEKAAPTTPIGTRELGIMKKNGWGEPMDPVGGLQLIRTAAERGDAVAQRIVAFAYDAGDSGLQHDSREAVAWFQKAAVQDDARAQRQLGVHLKTGDGVPADPTAALEWFKKAAAKGDAAAQAEVDAAAASAPH